MAVISIKNKTKSGSLLVGNTPFELGDYESIATTTLTTATASITFSSIPATYTHLQIRGIHRSAGGGINATMTANSDSGANYTYHYLLGNGSSASSAGAASQTTYSYIQGTENGSTANAFAASIIDILDYSNTNKYKTLRNLQGFDTNGAGRIILWSSVWMNTSAINSISISHAANFAQYSSFALYGIKG